MKTEMEYNFFKDFYTENYIDYITADEFDNFSKFNLFDEEIVTSEYNDTNTLSRGSIHETASKLIRISKACSSQCKVSIVVKWKKSPVVRSYDLLGVYLDNSSFKTISYAKLFNNGSNVGIVETNKNENALSTTIKLPSSGDNLEIIQSFDVQKTGTIYASYQHEKRSISLANSRKYSFSKYGYGKVFLFEESIRSYYDAMQGVSIDLN